MKAVLAASAAVLVASGASAQTGSLRGQWHVEAAADPSYTGIMLIDAQHRATLDAKGAKGVAQSIGYAKIDGTKVEVVLTNREKVERIICAMLSSDLLECRAVFPDGRFSAVALMKRVGPGPVSLMPAPR